MVLDSADLESIIQGDDLTNMIPTKNDSNKDRKVPEGTPDGGDAAISAISEKNI
jgi:hypothetical protein